MTVGGEAAEWSVSLVSVVVTAVSVVIVAIEQFFFFYCNLHEYFIASSTICIRCPSSPRNSRKLLI